MLLERGKIQCLLQFPACLGKGQQVEETDDDLVCLAVPLVDLGSSSVATRHSSSQLGSALAAPSVDNALNLYCHNFGALAVGGADVFPPWFNLSCFHSLTDDVCVVGALVGGVLVFIVTSLL